MREACDQLSNKHAEAATKTAHDWLVTLEEEWLTAGLDPRLTSSASEASERASRVCEGWGTTFKWATYKAVMRRGGAFAEGRFGPIDFNGDLVQPMFDAISVKWDEVFNQKFTGHVR